MTNVLKRSAYKNGYLIIAAAWLFTLSFLFANYFSSDSNPVKVAQTLSTYVSTSEKRFEEISRDTSLISNIISDRLSARQEDLGENGIGIFMYAINDRGNPIEIYWNTNAMAVSDTDLIKGDGFFPTINKNGFFEVLKKTIIVNDNKYLLVSLVPIYWTYTIEMENVQNRFAIGGYEKNYLISASGFPIVNSLNNTIFYIDRKNSTAAEAPGNISVILRTLAIILVLIFVNSIATDLAEKKRFLYGFLFLVFVLLTLRALSYWYSFPFNYRQLNLFEPTIYASNTLNRSLGDLLINTVLLFWIISFLKFNYQKINYDRLKVSQNIRKTIGIISLLFLPFFAIIVASSINTLITDGVLVSFDVTNFFNLNIYTLVSFIIICTLLLSFFYTGQLLAALSSLLEASLYWRVILLLSFSLLLLSIGITGDNDTLLNFSLIAWIILFYFLLNLGKQETPLSFYSSSYFMPWSIFLISSVSTMLIFQSKVLEQKKRQSSAVTVGLSNNYANAKILNVALTSVTNFFNHINYADLYNEPRNKEIKQELTSNNIQGYLNNFNTRIYTFDTLRRTLYNDDSDSYDLLKNVIINKSKPTDNPQLFYYESADNNSFSYIYEKTLYNSDSVLRGYFFLIITPRYYAQEELNPQLFKQLVKEESLVPPGDAYAIYNKNKLIKNSSNYNFSDTISKKQIPTFGSEFRNANGYSELWVDAGDNKVIVVVHKNDWFKESITFFAYLFVVFIILVLLQYFGNLIFKTHFKWEEIKKIFRFNIRSQIQTIIVAVSIISFIVIGVAIISYFIVTFKNTNDEKLRSTAEIITNEVQQLTANRFAAEDMISLKQLNLRLELQNKILEIAKIHNVDINFFDVNGNLLTSSQQYIYDNQILSGKMDAHAYNALHVGRSTQYIQEEKVVDYSFKSIYVPVKNTDGTTFAYLNIPFLNSQTELKQEISNFIVTIIILNALIFIIAGSIAIWVTRRITASFTLIGNKMKAISFGSVNEEIEWKKNDELGELVTEYNKMVKQLAESAKALARTEREGAWREMARQVAHEIKNPLTPMKLSIQYLQRAIDNNSPNVKELSNQVAGTLVEQIDQLSKIAGDFSQFANIGNVHVEIFDVTDVLASIVQLFSADEHIHIVWEKANMSCTIRADKTQMHRLFTNLIKNAIEAQEKQDIIKIQIKQSLQGNEVVVSVADNGPGIPANMRPKIFAPNFTTKSSGTGLGLAICKGIVEKANGNIWFTTKENEGTTFFVSLPLMHI